MQLYRDWDNDSNVIAYETGDDYIVVQFKSGRYRNYKYTDFSTGSYNISEMSRLANLGDGLNEFIGKHKPKYESKW